MKCITVTMFAVCCLGQPATPEPDMGDIFYRLDDGKLLSLERQSATIKGGTHGFNFVHMKTAAEFPGGRSPVRFKSGHLDLVVRSVLKLSTTDPNTVYCLRKLKVTKNSRELVMMSGHISPLGSSTTRNPAEGIVPVEFSRYGSSSLRMTTGELGPGEYAVGHPYGPAVFCFGVD